MSSTNNNQQINDELIIQSKKEIEEKRHELERLKHGHRIQQEQQEAVCKKYTKDFQTLSNLVRENGMNLGEALNSDHAEDRKRKRTIVDLRNQIHLANEQREDLMKTHRKEENKLKVKEGEFEKVKLIFSKGAKSPDFRDHAENLGVHFTLQTFGDKSVYIPNFTKNYAKHEKILHEKLPNVV
uniref:Uncharacterized protein n=1 Tax=Panagrolaimus sp. ES5 TaxID=591445 RepID=A0AC34FY26_9BILA